MYNKNFKSDRGGSRFGGGSNGGRKDPMMHKATCSKCGKSCEVPFRPTGAKPVYCRDCFASVGGPSVTTDKYPRREFDARPERKPEGNDDVKRQLELVNGKLDKLIALAESVLKPKQVVGVEEKAPARDKVALKKLVTKAVGKKPIKR